MTGRSLALAACCGIGALSLAGADSCSVYDEGLLVGAGGEGGDATGGSQGGVGPGGSGGGACVDATECPGSDTPCRKRSCDAGVCTIANTPAGTLVAEQAPGDCQRAQCDGRGGTETVADETDVEDDLKECTVDGCQEGLPTHVAEPAGTSCTQGGGKKCNADAACVECVVDGDCSSMVCDETFACAPPECGDMVKNGMETDVDCGGVTCPKCEYGEDCMLNGDCVGGTCAVGVCAASCTDGIENGPETDVDCGGPNCPKCPIGDECATGSDCVTGSCVGNTCQCAGNHLVISEVRSRGAGGGLDNFVEIYNPTSSAVTLDANWKIQTRSHSGSIYDTKWTGTGLVIPSHGHYLIGGSGYAQAPSPDGMLTSGVTDATSIKLVQGVTTVDAVCYYFSATTLNAFQTDPSFVCEGMPVNNQPHNDTTGGQSNSDASIERRPGGALGNCVDTGAGAPDWHGIVPARPENRNSPLTP